MRWRRTRRRTTQKERFIYVDAAGRVLRDEEEDDAEDEEEEEEDGDVRNRDDRLDGKYINSLFTLINN